METGLWIILGIAGLIVAAFAARTILFFVAECDVRSMRASMDGLARLIEQFEQDIEQANANTNVENARRALFQLQELYIEACYFYEKKTWRRLDETLENMGWVLENARIQLGIAEYKAKRQSS
jgi:hypothetical protein